MNKLSQLGIWIIAAFLVMIGLSTLAKLLIESLKHDEETRSGGASANQSVSS